MSAVDWRELLSIDRLHGTPAAAPPANPAGSAFAQLLDSPQDAAAAAPAAEAALAALDVAVQSADREFMALMQLRRQLEHAFHKYSQ